MTARQIPLHQAAIAYGTAYETVRAANGPDGIRARIECWSPREAIALYDDPARDTYPQLFMRRRRLNETRESLETVGRIQHLDMDPRRRRVDILRRHPAQRDRPERTTRLPSYPLQPTRSTSEGRHPRRGTNPTSRSPTA